MPFCHPFENQARTNCVHTVGNLISLHRKIQGNYFLDIILKKKCVQLYYDSVKIIIKMEHGAWTIHFPQQILILAIQIATLYFSQCEWFTVCSHLLITQSKQLKWETNSSASYNTSVMKQKKCCKSLSVSLKSKTIYFCSLEVRHLQFHMSAFKVISKTISW